MEAQEQVISSQSQEGGVKTEQQDLNCEKKEDIIVAQKTEKVEVVEKDKESNPLSIEKSDDKDSGGVLLDFSELFKKGGNGKMPTLQHRKQSNKTNKKVDEKGSENTTKEEIKPKDEAPNDEISSSSNNNPETEVAAPVKKNIIPKNLTITQEEMQQRKYLDQRRWFCLSRPQYQRSCGISSLMSCWNYLYSTLGTGQLPPISVEEALQILGVEREGKLFADTDFGDFTGNSTLIKWFKLLCRHFKVDGTAYIFWKVCGDNKTQGVDSNEALFQLEEGLRNENMTFIYHAYDHYFCPMGYEIVPRIPTDAYKKLEEIDPNEVDHWIFIGEPSKRFPAFHIKPWEEISKDISLGNPQYYDIRRPDKGIMERKGEYYKTKAAGTSIHCIMAFQRIIKKKKVVTEPKVKQELLKQPRQQTHPTMEELIAEEKLETIEARQEAAEVKEQEDENKEHIEKINNVIEVKNEEIQTIEIVKGENQCVIVQEIEEKVVNEKETDEQNLKTQDIEKDIGGQIEEKQIGEKEERKQDEEVIDKLDEIHKEEIDKNEDNKVM